MNELGVVWCCCYLSICLKLHNCCWRCRAMHRPMQHKKLCNFTKKPTIYKRNFVHVCTLLSALCTGWAIVQLHWNQSLEIHTHNSIHTYTQHTLFGMWFNLNIIFQCHVWNVLKIWISFVCAVHRTPLSTMYALCVCCCVSTFFRFFFCKMWSNTIV